MNVPADLLDQYADELFELDPSDHLARPRLALIANGLKNLAEDLRGKGGSEGERRRQAWWFSN